MKLKTIDTEQPFIPVNRLIKADIYHIDGHIDEIRMIMPVWTLWGEPQEIGGSMLQQFIFNLTTHFISPVKFQIKLGSIDKDGNEVWGVEYEPFEIPLGKVYVRNKGWVSPETAMN